MDRNERIKATRVAGAVAIIALVLSMGIMVRLADPMSTSVVPAEDPYTHMILVRGHIADGELDPVYDRGTLYPPGMHATLAATWSYTGMDLYDIFRVGPVVFGAIGLLGVALLVGRHYGIWAAVIATTAAALAPELIFRTTMMAPTAMDLAVLPFVFITILEALRGARLWLVPAGLLLAFLVVAHPWVVALLIPALIGWMLFALFTNWWSGPTARADPIAAAAILVMSGIAVAAAANICWDEGCGLEFNELVLSESSASLDVISWVIAGVAVGLGIGVFLLRRVVDRLQDAMERRSMPSAARLLTIPVIAAIVAAIVIPATQAGMPEFVDLPRMFGWPMLALAAIGLVLVFVIRSPLPMAMAGLAAVTLPFVIYNPFDSEYWPHRTAAYLGVALVSLAGIGGAAIINGLRAGIEWLSVRLPKTRPRPSRVLSIGSMATLIGTILVAGTVYAATPLEYEDGWYRLYPECEFDALRAVAEDYGDDTIIVTGTWQGKLVAGAFADDADNVWYSWEMFAQDDRRGGTIKGQHLEGRDVIMIEDRFLRTERPGIDTSFFDEEPWQSLGEYCGEGVAEPRMQVHIARAVDA